MAGQGLFAVVGAVVCPFFHFFAVGQDAHAVFAAVLVFADFRLAALLHAVCAGGVGGADGGRLGVGLGGSGLTAGAGGQAEGGHQGEETFHGLSFLGVVNKFGAVLDN